MLTQEDDVDAHALAAKGWTISAIARHLGHDRKTIRAYLKGGRAAGVRAPTGDDQFERFVDYTRERLQEDPQPVGRHAPRRTDGARVRAVVSDVDPPDPRPRPAAGV